MRAIIKQVGNSIDNQKSERNGKSRSMLYTIPDYYHEFTCVAGKCEDTCCAGWQIVADDASLENYKNETGTFAERLKESVNWE